MAFGVYTTTGWGEFRDPDVIEFDCSFLEEPIVTYGYSINDDILIDTRFPRAHGFVTRWKQDPRGCYTGCWVATTVDTQSPYIATTKPEPGYSLDHNFTFSGIALKELPTFLMDD